jgi:hypothetical protein
MKDALQEYISSSRKARASTADVLGADFGVSRMTILWALVRLNYHRVEPTFKPCLTDRMRAAWLAFALEHRN